ARVLVVLVALERVHRVVERVALVVGDLLREDLAKAVALRVGELDALADHLLFAAGQVERAGALRPADHARNLEVDARAAEAYGLVHDPAVREGGHTPRRDEPEPLVLVGDGLAREDVRGRRPGLVAHELRHVMRTPAGDV